MWRDRRLTLRPGRRADQPPRQRARRRRPRRAQRTVPTCAGHESAKTTSPSTSTTATSTSRRCSARTRLGVAPFNVNYRYVAEELRYLLNDSKAQALVFHSAFADRVAEVRDALPDLVVLLQVDDGSGAPAARRRPVWYEEALAAASPTMPPLDYSPDDLYILYTGGTTGMPEGRAVALGRHLRGVARRPRPGGRVGEHRRDRRGREERRFEGAARRRRSCTAPATGSRSSAFTGGNTVVIQDDVVGLDAARHLGHRRTREGVDAVDRGRRLRSAARRSTRQGRAPITTTCRRCSPSFRAARR